MNDTMRRWLVSSGITFLTGFLIVIAGSIDSITPASLMDGTIVGILFAGFRAGIKAVVESFLAQNKNG
jgi:hypothetical protein